MIVRTPILFSLGSWCTNAPSLVRTGLIYSRLSVRPGIVYYVRFSLGAPPSSPTIASDGSWWECITKKKLKKNLVEVFNYGMIVKCLSHVHGATSFCLNSTVYRYCCFTLLSKFILLWNCSRAKRLQKNDQYQRTVGDEFISRWICFGPFR